MGHVLHLDTSSTQVRVPCQAGVPDSSIPTLAGWSVNSALRLAGIAPCRHRAKRKQQEASTISLPVVSAAQATIKVCPHLSSLQRCHIAASHTVTVACHGIALCLSPIHAPKQEGFDSLWSHLKCLCIGSGISNMTCKIGGRIAQNEDPFSRSLPAFGGLWICRECSLGIDFCNFSTALHLMSGDCRSGEFEGRGHPQSAAV